MARDAVASATRDAGDIRCEVGIAPVFSWSRITKKPANDPEEADQPDLLGLRDRVLIAIMVYSFARIGAVIQMKVGDYFVQGRRRWVRLHEKGGKEHDVPCHHRLDQCLHDYIEAAGITDDVD